VPEPKVDIADRVRAQAEFVDVAKVHVIERRAGVTEGTDIMKAAPMAQQSNQVTREDYATAFTMLGALDPVYDPEMLALLFEHSNSLRQNVDAYATNIDGFGHRFDPVFDLQAPDADNRIKVAMIADAEREGNEIEPTPEVVTAKRNEIAKEMRREKAKLEFFFEFCCPETSFVTLRRWARQDLEVMGNAYWEVLRDAGGRVAQFLYMPGFTVRLLPLDVRSVVMDRDVRVSDLSFETVQYATRLRRYVQIVEGKTMFFKQFGDKRVISSGTGAAYNTTEEMLIEEPDATPATEIMHFKIHSSRSSYGIPRWIGNLLGVIGSRQAEEVNFNYSENKSVPPLAVLISGGKMSTESVTRIQDYIEGNLKGKRNFHKILVIEADTASGAQNTANGAKLKIDIKPLTMAQQNDALFQNYDERNIDKVGQSFRLPRMLRGDIRDFNRSTADAALVFAEVQVFEPERQEFDFIINRKLLAALGIKFWKFISLAPVIRDPSAMSEIIKNLANANVLTPAECRELAGDVFNRSFPKLTAPWTQQPGAFTIAGLPVTQEKPSTMDGEATAADAGEEGNYAPPEGEGPNGSPIGEGVQARKIKKSKAARIAKREVQRLLGLRKALGLFEEQAWMEYLMTQATIDDAAE